MLDSIFLTVIQWMTGGIGIVAAGIWFRKLARTTIAVLGGYFIIMPFLN